MKKTLFLCTCASLGYFLSACEVKSENPFNRPNPNEKARPAYSEQNLAGKVFGKEWKAKIAVVRPNGNNNLTLDIYSEAPASPCKLAYPSSPYVSMVIPVDFSEKEYSLSYPSSSMLVFTGLTDISKNVIADEAKLKISGIEETGFQLHLYAKATEHDGTISEVNGKIQAIDCRTQVDFKIWDEFTGWYDLIEFDGKEVYADSVITKYETSKFYHRPSEKYVNTFVIPLFYAVKDNLTSSYSVGPMEGLGTTTVNEEQNIKTIKYNYQGPINLNGMDYTLNLNMTVVKALTTVSVSYTLEIPGQVNKVSHSFKLKK